MVLVVCACPIVDIAINATNAKHLTVCEVAAKNKLLVILFAFINNDNIYMSLGGVGPIFFI